MRYETFAKMLSRYEKVERDGCRYYVLNGKVVATQKKNLIVMYFASPGFGHHAITALAVAKDFVLVQGYKKSVADVIIANSLCGACNTVERTSNRLLKVISSNDVSFEESVPYVVGNGLIQPRFQIGAIGEMVEGGKFTFKNLTITVPVDMCDFDFDNLNYCILKSKRNRKKKRKFIQKKDYEVYTILRNEKKWYWEEGYNTCNSDRIRSMINMTLDENYHKIVKAKVDIA